MYAQKSLLPQVLWNQPPAAVALLQGSKAHPHLTGQVQFYPYRNGSFVLTSVTGLPMSGFFAMHIHEGNDCRTGGDTPFSSAGAHYNPNASLHPNHAGDLPVLLSDNKFAFSCVYTGRFQPQDVVNRTVIIHDQPDDYRSQPAGDSGSRIACGVIRATQGNRFGFAR